LSPEEYAAIRRRLLGVKAGGKSQDAAKDGPAR
jgi:hypothetical protein